jgi:hypothetical protein
MLAPNRDVGVVEIVDVLDHGTQVPEAVLLVALPGDTPHG